MAVDDDDDKHCKRFARHVQYYLLYLLKNTIIFINKARQQQVYEWLLVGGRPGTRSEESGVGVLDDAPLAVFLDGLVPVRGYLAILYVELLEAPAVVRDQLYAAIGDQVAVAEAELFQIGTALCQRPEARVAHVAFADVERPETGARPRQHGDGIVADRLAAAYVQVPQLVAPARYYFEPGVAHLIALGHRQISQQRPQLGQLVQPEVGHLVAVRNAQLFERRTETRHELYTGVCKKPLTIK